MFLECWWSSPLLSTGNKMIYKTQSILHASTLQPLWYMVLLSLLRFHMETSISSFLNNKFIISFFLCDYHINLLLQSSLIKNSPYFKLTKAYNSKNKIKWIVPWVKKKKSIPRNWCSEEYNFILCSTLISDLEKGVIIASLPSPEENCRMVINL